MDLECGSKIAMLIMQLTVSISRSSLDTSLVAYRIEDLSATSRSPMSSNEAGEMDDASDEMEDKVESRTKI